MVPTPQRMLMSGLLDDNESLAPSLLSAWAARPGAAPAQQGLLDMASTPGAPPGPAAPPQPGPPPVSAAPPRGGGPGVDPLRTGVVAGGLQMLGDASTPTPYKQTIGSLVSRALQAGVPAFIASKQAKEQRMAMEARERSFKDMLSAAVEDKTLSPEQARLASQMGAEQGLKYLEELQKEKQKITVVGNTAIRGDGTVVHQGGDRFKVVNDQIVALDGGGNVVLGDDGKPKIMADLRSVPDVMSDTQKGIATSLGLDPNNTKSWTPEQTKEFNLALFNHQRAGASSNVTNILTDTADAAAARGTVENFDTSRKDAQGLRSDYIATQRALTTLRQGTVNGSFANARVGLATLKRSLGLPTDGTEENTKIYMMQIAERVLPIVRTLAPVTEEDVALLTKVKGGDLSISNAQLQRFLGMQQLAAGEGIEEHNRRVRNSGILSERAKPDYLVELPPGYTPQSSQQGQKIYHDGKDGRPAGYYRQNASGEWELVP